MAAGMESVRNWNNGNCGCATRCASCAESAGSREGYDRGYRAGLIAASRMCDEVSGNTKDDHGSEHRRGAGNCAAAIRFAIKSLTKRP